jgi:hypothetical protein
MSRELEHLIQRAREERCLLRDYWERAADLGGREQLRLAEALMAITPATVQRNRHCVRCESRFKLRPKDRRRIAERLLADGESATRVANAVPGISRATAYRLARQTPISPPTNRIDKREKVSKRAIPVHRPRCAYLDATSGANLEAPSGNWSEARSDSPRRPVARRTT